MPFHVKISGTCKLFGDIVYREMSMKVHWAIYRLIRKILRNHYAKEKKLLVTHTFSLGCSSVIEYSRNLIWPRSIFFISSVWCWFSYGVLINSNNVWIWGIIQISKIFARLWQFSFLFYMCYNFLLMTRSLGCA